MYKHISSNRSKLENFAPKILSCAELIVLSIRNANIVSDGKASELGIRNFPSQPLNSQLPILNSQLYIINVLLLSNTAFSWPISISTLKVQIFLTFLLKSFGDTEKSYTFASAFENELDKPNEQNEACFGYVMAKVRIKRTKPQAKRDWEEFEKSE